MAWIVALLVGLMGGERVDPGPCSDGGWGAIPAGDVVHVRIDGTDDGDGSADAPLRTLAAAVDLAGRRDALNRVIGVGPGIFPTDPIMVDETQVGVTLAGCGVGSTLLAATDHTEPLVSFAGGSAGGLAGLALLGGAVGVEITDGAVALLSDIQISGAFGPGVLVDQATVEIDGVMVLPPSPDAECGYGLSVTAGVARGEELMVVGALGLGIFLQDAVLSMDLVDVALTVMDPGAQLGRGLHAQDSFVSVRSGAFSGNVDASLFIDDSWADLQGIVIDITGAGVVGDVLTGDGLVVVDDGTRRVRLLSSRVIGSPRAAVLLDGASMLASDTIVEGTGLELLVGAPFGLQNGARLIGGDSDLGAALDSPLPYVRIDPVCGV
ncbi:MAG: hypothetical protein ACI8PZ_002047 [Myxococcota bacterium]|jgi:hypothetical protein